MSAELSIKTVFYNSVSDMVQCAYHICYVLRNFVLTPFHLVWPKLYGFLASLSLKG